MFHDRTAQPQNGPGMLYQIQAPHFTAAIVVEGGVVVSAAPILRWSIGKELDGLLNYFKRKQWSIAHVATD